MAPVVAGYAAALNHREWVKGLEPRSWVGLRPRLRPPNQSLWTVGWISWQTARWEVWLVSYGFPGGDHSRADIPAQARDLDAAGFYQTDTYARATLQLCSSDLCASPVS